MAEFAQKQATMRRRKSHLGAVSGAAQQRLGKAAVGCVQWNVV